MATEYLKRAVPGYGCWRACHGGTPHPIEYYENRAESGHSHKVKNILISTLQKVDASSHSTQYSAITKLTRHVNRVIATQPGTQPSTTRVQDITRLINERFKIVDANSEEGRIFSAAAEFIGSVPKSTDDYSYVICVDPDLTDKQLETLLVKEVSYILNEELVCTEECRGAASLTATLAAWYFGCPLPGIFFSAAAADGGMGAYRHNQADWRAEMFTKTYAPDKLKKT